MFFEKNLFLLDCSAKSPDFVATILSCKTFIIAAKSGDFAEPHVNLQHFVELGLSDVELDKSLIDNITAIQLLKEEDRKDILNTINALVRDAKARSAYAS